MTPADPPPSFRRDQRVRRLRRLLAENQMPWFLVSRLENVYYLAGFNGSSGVALVGGERAFLLTDSRYARQAYDQARGWEVVITRKPWEELRRILGGGSRSLAFEETHVTYSTYQALREHLPDTELRPANGWVERLRRVKDRQEIDAVRRSAEILCRSLLAVAPAVREGIREREVAAELEYRLRKEGAERAAFETIVASGERSALPHGVAGDRPMRWADLVVVDCGAVYSGYCSDITRTFCVGEPTEKQRRVYDIVLEAQRRALERVGPGVPVKDIDGAAREFIASEGYAEAFGHGTGHGVGLSIHEEPRVSEENEEILEAGSVVTIEPGVYLGDWGGVRIEDLVLVTEGGAEVLTAAVPKEGLGPPD